MLVRSKPPGGGCWFALVALAVTFFAGQASAGPVDGLCGALARQAERAEGIPPGLVHALALAESGRWFAADGATRPWPWTVNVAGTPDASYKVFKNLDDKNKQHTNLTARQRIPGEHAFVLQRIGVDVLQALGSTLASAADIKEALYNGFIEFKLGSRLVAEGVLVSFPSGRGVTGGYGSDTSAASNHALTNGVPSSAATPSSLQPQLVAQ